MDFANLKAAWASYDAKLEKSIKLNLHFVEQIQTQKVRSNMASLMTYRIIELGFHIIAVVLLLLFLVNNLAQFKYAFSAFALLGFYISAIIMCLQQITVIKRMDFSNEIVFMQTSILKLRTHMINSMRMAVLFIPAFVGFPLVVSKAIQDLDLNALSFMDLESQFRGDWWQIQLICVIILTPLCILFYQLVSEKNIQRPWVRKTIRITAGQRIEAALELLNELKHLKKDMA
jgi:hypothetical protein